MKKQETQTPDQKKFVPYGMNGMYFVYDNEVGQIPMNYGTKGANKATIQKICDDLNLREAATHDQKNMFTGGDWFVKGRGTGNDPFWIESSAAPNVPIAEIMIPYGKKMAELKANAALIAEAPAMYKALKDMSEIIKRLDTWHHLENGVFTYTDPNRDGDQLTIDLQESLETAKAILNRIK